MSFTVTERNSGRKPADGDSPSNEIPYLILADAGETGEEEEALLALRAAAPATLGDLTIKQAKIEERLVDGWYLGTVSYGSAEQNKDTDESSFSFDTTGGTFNVKHAISQTGFAVGTAPDVANGINVTAEGVEGVDVVLPQYAFSETHYIDDADVDDTYKGVLFALTGTVCDDNFKGGAAGEILFMGAQGQKRGRGDWEITFNFGASPNVTGLTIGTITGINKQGWDYLWATYQKEPVGAGADKALMSMPKAVYVAKVYPDADHSLLGIGTT
jgi:hypothetical protein